MICKNLFDPYMEPKQVLPLDQSGPGSNGDEKILLTSRSRELSPQHQRQSSIIPWTNYSRQP